MSESVFNIVQLAQQADTTTAIAAKKLFPVDAGAVIDEDRSPTSPDEDYGENAVGQPGRGTYGMRGAMLSLAGEVRAEDFIEILSMHAKGAVTATDGATAYSWAYPWDLTSDTVKRYTIEGGPVDTVNDQWRAVGCICNSLEVGFDALTAPGNAPWRYTAGIEALYRERSDLTAGLVAYTPLETLEGHMTQLFQGATTTAYDSLAEATATLKSFKLTSEMLRVRRAYGGSADYASAWGYSGRKTVNFTAEVAINATTHVGVSDVFETAGSTMTERRWRIVARGSRLTTQNEVQDIVFANTPTGGTWTLSFDGYTTTALAYNITKTDLQTALRLLPNIATITITGTDGGPYVATWTGLRAASVVPLMVGNGTLLTGAGAQPTATVTRFTAGGQLKSLTLDFRCRFHVVNIGNVDGERVYTVEGIAVKDPAANSGTTTDMCVTILNGIPTQLTLV